MDNTTSNKNNLDPHNHDEKPPSKETNDELFGSTDRYLNGANKFIISERLRKKIIFITKMGGLKENENFFDTELDWKTIHNYDDPFTQLFLDYSVETICPELVRKNYEYLSLFWKNIKTKAESAEDRSVFSNTYGQNFWNEALNILDNVFDKLSTEEKINYEKEKIVNKESAKLNFVLINKIDKRLAENILTPDDVKGIFAEGEKLKITKVQTVEILWYHLIKLGWKPINGEKDELKKIECLLNLDWGPLNVMELKSFIEKKLHSSKSSNGIFKKIIIEAETLGIGEEQAIFVLWNYLVSEGWMPLECEIDESKKKEILFNCEWVPGNIKFMNKTVQSSLKENRLSKEQIENILTEAVKQNIKEEEILNALWKAFDNADWQPVEGEKDEKDKKSCLLSNDWAASKTETIKPIERTYMGSAAAQRRSPVLVTVIVGLLAAIIFFIFGLPALLENKDAIAEKKAEVNVNADLAQMNSEIQQNQHNNIADNKTDKISESNKDNEPKEKPIIAEVKNADEEVKLDESIVEEDTQSLDNVETTTEDETASAIAAVELMYNESAADFENAIRSGKVEIASSKLKRLNSLIEENNLNYSTTKYKRILNKINDMVYIPGTNIYMDKFEITVRDYKEYSKTKAGIKFPFLPDWNQDDFQPLINVSFNEAEKFANNNGKRLPTLDEWKAAAGLSQSNDNYFNDDESPREYANVYDLVSSSKDTYTRTAPVGKFAPNKNNLYDLIGNVEEWCVGPNNIPTCVGGHFRTKESRSRTFRINTHKEDYTSDKLGFRCVVDIDSLLKYNKKQNSKWADLHRLPFFYFK